MGRALKRAGLDDDTINVLIAISIFAALFIGGIIYGIYSSVRRMAASPQLELAPELLGEINRSIPADLSSFLLTRGFRPVEAYRFHRIRLAIWMQPDGPPSQYFSFYRTPTQSNFEFVAGFSDDGSLTTTRGRAAFIFPRPFGAFIQSFPNSSIEQLWDLHVKGTQHLISDVSIPTRECSHSFPKGFRRSIVRQLSLIRSLPLWPVRGVYWFLVKRFLLHNRPVWKQDIARLYPPALPND